MIYINLKLLLILNCLFGLTLSIAQAQNDEVDLNADDNDKGDDEILDFEDTENNPVDREQAAKLDESTENTMTFIRIFTGKYYEGPYKTINDYLTKNVDEDDNLKANMEAAQKLMEDEKHKLFKTFKQGLIEALDQFLSLANILSEENKCSRRSYATLIKNDRATKGAAHKCSSKLGPKELRRIDSIVHQYSLKHAIECRDHYPIAFRTMREQLENKEMLERVELITLNMIQKRRKKVLLLFEQKKTDDPMKLIPTGKAIKRFKGKDLAQSIYKSVEFLAKDDENSKYLKKVPNEKKDKMIIDENGLKQLLTEYVVEPCKYYVEQFGPDIFIPVKYDITMLEKKDRYRVEEVGDFFLGWIRFRLCNTLLTKDKDSMFKDVIRVAKKQKQT